MTRGACEAIPYECRVCDLPMVWRTAMLHLESRYKYTAVAVLCLVFDL